jgi:hypothetical protein
VGRPLGRLLGVSALCACFVCVFLTWPLLSAIGKLAGAARGLSGSNAGLARSPISGRGVDGVMSCCFHLVPLPLGVCTLLLDCIGVLGVSGYGHGFSGGVVATRRVWSRFLRVSGFKAGVSGLVDIGACAAGVG